MTVSSAEAHAVNTVIAFLAGRHGYEQSQPPLPPRWQVVDALATLADSANRRLHVGYDAARARDALTEPWALERAHAAELERLRPWAEAGMQAAREASARDAQTRTCDDCFCCNQARCHPGPGSSCPTNSLGESVCPCTGD